MTEYITVADMDALGNATWDALDTADKARAVAQANAWLSAQSLREWDEQPEAVTQAAQQLALLAGEGRLYADASTGTIKRERVKAGSVESETEYEEGGVTVPGVIAYVNDLLKPWLRRGGAVRMLAKV